MKRFSWLITLTIFVAIVLAIVLIRQPLIPAYGDTPEYSPENFETELERNRAKWDEAQINHYTMLVDAAGYAYTYNEIPWTLEVLNNRVVSAINAQGESVPVNDAAQEFTVTALFGLIEDYYQREPPVVSMRLTYNPTYGYPASIDINPWAEPCCQGFTIEVQDFKILP
jgi:hypothetical protein